MTWKFSNWMPVVSDCAASPVSPAMIPAFPAAVNGAVESVTLVFCTPLT